MKKLALIILSTMMVLPAFAQKDVVATVNGRSITKKQFEEYHGRIPAGQAGLCDWRERKR